MAISRAKTWSAGEVLTASDLNSEFNNVLNNGVDLWSPATKACDLNGFELILDGDADTSITADTDDRIDLRLGGVDLFVFDGTTASCVNGFTFTGTVTTAGPTIAATGSDTNIPATLKGKGTGKVVLGQATSTEVQHAADQPITDSSGNEFIKFSKTGTAVNELTFSNAATGTGPTISATGGDTDVPINLAPKGAGTLNSTGRLTTTDGVASGTVKVVGGLAKSGISAVDSVTAATSNNAFVDFATTYPMPASTLKSGSVLKARAMVRVSDASGADTLTVKLVLGTTDLISTTAVDPGATTDLHIMEFEITSRAAPSASSSLVGSGRWITNTGGTIAQGTGLLGATNFATNGALTLKASAKWSTNTANTACLLESFNVWID